MRAAASFGALAAGSLVQFSAAQAAGPGSSDNDVALQAYGELGNAPQGDPRTTGQGFPDGAPQGQSCVGQATSTIFVTVYPTSPVSTGGPGSHDTVYQTIYPTTQTLQVSPVGSVQVTHTSVSIYTTITVDIWGTGSDSEQHPGTIVSVSESASPISVDASLPSNESPAGGIPDYGVSTGDVGPAPAPTSIINGYPGPQGPSAWFTVVTDTDVHWTAGVTGPSPVTILSEHTIFFPGPSGAVGGGGPLTCLTTTGPDGRPTIIEWPAGGPSGNQGQSDLPNSQATPTGVGAQWPGVTASSALGVPAATTYTVIGTDGIPTVIQSSWYIPQLPSTTVPGSVSIPVDASASGQIQVIPNGPAMTTSTSYTFVGADGKPTVVESTLVLPGPAATEANLPGYSGIGPAQVTASLVPTTYTVIGANGLPSVVDTTFLVPPPGTPATNVPGDVLTGVPFQITVVPGNIQSGDVLDGITTCMTYTAIGPDGKPTAIESTVVMPASHALPSGVSVGFPSPVPTQQTNLPQGVSVGSPITTRVTIDILGPNGVATPVVGTVVLTPAFGTGTSMPPATTIAYPSMAPQRPQTDLPQGQMPPATSNVAISTCLTVDIVGPNGVTTPYVQTVVFTPPAISVDLPTAVPVATSTGIVQAPGPVIPDSGDKGGVPGLDTYGTSSALPPVVVSGVDGQAATDATPMTLTVLAGPNGSPVFSEVPIPLDSGTDANGPPAYGSGHAPAGGYGWGLAGPASYGSSSSILAPQPVVADSNMQTSTWTNVIPEATTTYNLNFPMTTLVTLAARAPNALRKRGLRRQESSLSSSSWNNATSAASPSPDETLPPVPPGPPATGDGTTTPAMCPSGGKVGKITVNFDNTKPGPLFNPSDDVWFSQGFLVAPPSSQLAQSYVPSSGGQLVEFVPPSLSPSNEQGASDTAQIGLGPNSASPCFRFNLLGANLGCAAQASEQWCEFEISAYTWDVVSSSEQAIAWSETKRVPACPDFPNGSCSLTPVQFEGYTNITSVLIRLHVGLELRAWWGDDFEFEWTDNGCEAASCRARALPNRVKRESVMSALRSGVWHWTPEGLQRLDDEYIWESAN
ncbi:hypothetical protein CDD82_3980 [Ophiocordyceps australis]|uniref:DUF7371 domain-containing protein n=1 Tax=Ophiocordyceps australis TaxID=1399860 RepID=A0A2C5Z3P6_9HYPO|nr:hypothetical protein CDD82_3980 [Ophiocordyceps australis]